MKLQLSIRNVLACLLLFWVVGCSLTSSDNSSEKADQESMEKKACVNLVRLMNKTDFDMDTCLSKIKNLFASCQNPKEVLLCSSTATSYDAVLDCKYQKCTHSEPDIEASAKEYCKCIQTVPEYNKDACKAFAQPFENDTKNKQRFAEAIKSCH